MDLGIRPRQQGRGLVGELTLDLPFRIGLSVEQLPDVPPISLHRQPVGRQVVDVGQLARLVTIIGRKAAPGIVELVEAVGQWRELRGWLAPQFEPVDPRTIDHPVERVERQAVLRIAAADVGMHADEPELAHALFVNQRQLAALDARRRPALRHRHEAVGGLDVAIVPEHWLERVALVLEPEGMTATLDLPVHETVGQRQRPVPIVDGTHDFLDRSAIGVHRIPHPKEFDSVDGNELDILVARLAQHGVADKITDRAQHVQMKARRGLRRIGLAVISVGGDGALPQRGFIAVIGREAEPGDQAGDDADGECPAAEAEAEDAVARLVVAAAEAIDVENVALQPDAEDAGECRPPFERRGADAIVVERDLPGRVSEVERLKQPPDIGLEDLCGAVSRPVGQQDNIPWHGRFRFEIARASSLPEIAFMARHNQSESCGKPSMTFSEPVTLRSLVALASCVTRRVTGTA